MSIARSVISALLIAFIFFIWNDFINRPSDLSGAWIVKDQIMESESSQYKGLTLVFEVLLQQNGNNISGTAEKVAEIKKSGDRQDIIGDKRTRLEVVGTLKNNFILKDEAVIHIVEHGPSRDTSSIMNLRIMNKDNIKGSFISTGADSKGTSIWTRQ